MRLCRYGTGRSSNRTFPSASYLVKSAWLTAVVQHWLRLTRMQMMRIAGCFSGCLRTLIGVSVIELRVDLHKLPLENDDHMRV